MTLHFNHEKRKPINGIAKSPLILPSKISSGSVLTTDNEQLQDYSDLRKALPLRNSVRYNSTGCSPTQRPRPNQLKVRKKEDALQKYCQSVSMNVDSESVKLLTEFMGVLNDDSECQSPIKINLPHLDQSHSVHSSEDSLPKTPNPTRHSFEGKSPILGLRRVQEGHMGTSLMNPRDLMKCESRNLAKTQSKDPRPARGNQGRGSLTNTVNGTMLECKQLQSRARQAIEKSMKAIRKFRVLRQSHC